MTRIINAQSKRRRPARLAAGLVIAAMFALGTFAGSASAQDRRGEYREGHHHWTGGYYRAPPVVYYGSPYYYPPPVVYGPGPGFNFRIR
jgi:hypothetical protein